MNKKSVLYYAVTAAFVAAYSGTAVGVEEVEPNNLISTAQHLSAVGSDGSVTVNSIMGVLSTVIADRVADADFYSFDAKAGETVNIDIDNGMKSSGISVDTMLFVFRPDLSILDMNNTSTVDPGSLPNPTNLANTRDARLDGVTIPADGRYFVGVTSSPRVLLDGGVPSPGTANLLNSTSMGAYTLIISGLTPAVQHISIEVKPGMRKPAPVNPKAKGVVPVALLSSPEFDPMSVDTSSLTFGATGDESSLAGCQKNNHRDLNDDGKPDLVCHFDNERSNFGEDNLSGFAKGKTQNGKQFQGRGWLKVVPKAE